MKKFLLFVLTIFASFMLFACGEEKLVVEFDTAGGNTIASVELELEKIGDFKLPEAPVKEGFEFKGWYLDAEFTKEFTSLEGFEGTIKLYAKWEEVKEEVIPTQVYKVNFYVDGALVDTFEGMGLTLTYPEVEEKEGKSFIGWYTDEACTELFVELGNKLEVSLYGKYVVVADDSVLVKYVINGKAYENVIVKKAEFALANPKLEANNEFLGWYKDAYMTEKFEALTDEKEIELYGISVPTINGTYEYSLNTTVSQTVGTQSQDMNVEVAVKLQLKDFNLVKLEKSELALVIDLKSNMAENIAYKMYLKDSKLYIEEEGEMAYVNIEQILPELVAEYKEYIAMLKELENEESYVPSVSSELLEILMDLELTAEQEAAIKDLVNILKPTEVKDGNSVTYTITDAQIQSFIAELAEFVSTYAKDLLKDVLPLIMGNVKEDQIENEFVDFEGNKFVYGEAGWYDPTGKFHSYAEDTECEFGMINSFGYYVPYYMYGTAFDTQDNYKLILGTGAMNWDTYEEVFITFDPDGWYELENGVKVFHEVSEDFENQNYGYVEGGYYYADSGNIYNMTTGELVSEEDLYEEQIDLMIEEFVSTISMISTLFKANALQSKVEIYENNAGCKVQLLGDVTINMPAESGITGTMNYKLNLTSEFKISQEVPTIDFPSFEGAEDMTGLL